MVFSVMRTPPFVVLAILGLLHCGPQADDGVGGGTASDDGGSTEASATATASGTGVADGTGADATSAGSGAMTSAGSDCQPWETSCGGECVDTQTDPGHCGGCGNVCGMEVCAEGMCSAGCGDLTQCGQSCVDLEGDSLHCGECDSPCDEGQLCGEGECESFSPTGCDSCPCDECRDNCCEIGEVAVCAMGECP